jgi:anti-sigma B factor antagonist
VGMESPPFSIEVTAPSKNSAIITLEGEVDMGTAPQLREAVVKSVELGARQVVIDLARVTFIDSTALGVIVGALKRVCSVNGRLALVCVEERVRKVFEITGLTCLFGIYETRQEALSASTLE